MVAVILAIRLPFLHQAIQGDDVYYLAGAQHAQIDPAHPLHTRYGFLGEMVDMRGHPHPPLNVWFLALLLALVGDIHEVPFHAAYILFSIVAALAMLSIARRFSPKPVWATLLFLSVPAFVINGNSLEADVPFLAMWLLAVALFVREKGFRWSAIPFALAGLAAYQSVFLIPILGVYTWMHHRHCRTRWFLLLTPLVAIGAWQLFELLTTGRAPASVLGGHFERYGFQRLANKLRNAGALTVHAAWFAIPAWLATRRKWNRETQFLWAWIAIFFAGALVVFFAGSARYLLPIAAPAALLISRAPVNWLAGMFAAQMALSLALAHVNYQHWDGYRRFAANVAPQAANRRIWINGEWGLQYYFEAEGGLPLLRGQAVRPGEIVVSSELAYPVEFTTGGGIPVPLVAEEIRPVLPLRTIGVGTRSAYSAVVNGYWPFDISLALADRVRAEMIVERQPTLEDLQMGSPDASRHIVSGIYETDDGKNRWMGARGVILFKSPAAATPLHATFFIPDEAPARRVTMHLDGQEVASRTYSSPGSHTLTTPPILPKKETATVTISVDKTFTASGDRRELGMVLARAGFVR